MSNITALKGDTLILNGKIYTKDSIKSTKSKVSFQTITIINQQNHINYEILGYDPAWTYRVYLGSKGSLQLISETDTNYKYEIEGNTFRLLNYNTEGPYTFLIVGVAS